MPNRTRQKILSVDDNESNRYIMRRILEKQGYEVIEAATGEEAIQMLDEVPDLVVLDVNLPDTSGFDVCRMIKSKQSSLPVLQVSASFIQNSDKVQGLESGADAYLAQPIDASVIVATIKSALRVRQAEREKEGLINELKMERALREKFLTTLTHDLRNPLAAAKMSAQLLERKKSLDESETKILGRILSNIDRTDFMIQNILDVNLIKAGQKLPFVMVECKLADVIEDIVENYKPILGSRLQFKMAVPELVGFWAPDGLKRALENLVTNAAKYGAAETPVIVEASMQGSDHVKLSVTNFGNVISAEEQPTLFEDYQRTPSAISSGNKGWGLGLTLVKGVAESHGGHAEVSSSEKEGTVFSIVFPVDSRPYGVSSDAQT